MNRRQFLTTSAALTVCGKLPPISATPLEAPSLEIIDCHTHFYDPTRPQGVPWPKKESALWRRVLPSDLRALPKFRPLTGALIVEASPWIDDNQWLLDLAKDDPFIVGIVGNLSPDAESFTALAKRFAQNPLYRGIRLSSATLRSLLDTNLFTNLSVLADLNLTLDVNGGPEGLPLVARLATWLPSLRIILNHIGNVEVSAASPPKDWQEGIRLAASHSNVFCKISALVEGASRGGRKAPNDPAFYAPYLEIVWEAFGENRVIYGSNWPVSESAADYGTVQYISTEYAASRGQSALAKFCSQNGKTAYQWGEHNKPTRG